MTSKEEKCKGRVGGREIFLDFVRICVVIFPLMCHLQRISFSK